MADSGDLAAQHSELFLRNALATHDGEVDATPPRARDCLDCGALIPSARLRAVPTTERCVDCQASQEHRS